MKIKEVYRDLRKNPAFKTLERLSGLILLMIVFSILTPKFFSLNNLLTVTLQMAIYSVLALGISYVLIIGGAELSAGSVVGLTGMVFVTLLSMGVQVVLAALLALGISLCIGFFNGFMVTKMHMIPFIATLGTQYIARGFTQILSNGSSISLRTAAGDDQLVTTLNFIGSGRIFNVIPFATLIVLGFLLIHYIILNKTTLGRKIYAVGSNSEVARLSGIKSDKITITAYMISACMAGFAGLLLVMRVSTAQATAGVGYEFEGIAASVIGGISMLGGEGNITGAIIGAAILAVMRNGMNLMGINAFWQNIITGFVIVFAVYMDINRRRREAGKL